MSEATLSSPPPVLKDIVLTSINTIRTLSMDGVQAANSGHPRRRCKFLRCGHSSARVKETGRGNYRLVSNRLMAQAAAEVLASAGCR